MKLLKKYQKANGSCLKEPAACIKVIAVVNHGSRPGCETWMCQASWLWFMTQIYMYIHLYIIIIIITIIIIRITTTITIIIIILIIIIYIYKYHMEVSWNGGAPKSSIWIGFSIINQPFWVAPFMDPPIYIFIYVTPTKRTKPSIIWAYNVITWRHDVHPRNRI